MAAIRQSEAEPHADSLWNNAVTRAIRDNPALAAVLLGGMAAVTGPQMIAALQKIGGNKALEFARRLEPHAAEATKAWEMVGGSGPTKLRYLGGGIDAQAFGVRPGGVILKMSRPETHLGFDPHRTAETAPRDVLLPVLEHGKFGTPGREVSWFVQPRAHLHSERRLPAAIRRRTGQEPTPVDEAYRKLKDLMRERGDPWGLIDTHAGNIGHWAGRDWVIDLGTMWPTGPRPPRVPTPPPPPAPSPVSTPPTPPGWQPRVQPTSHPNRVWFADQPTSHLPAIARNFLEPNLKRRGEAIIEFKERMRAHTGQGRWTLPPSLRALWNELVRQARARGEPFI